MKRMEPKEAPPQFFLRFFRWYCDPKVLGYIEGDLMEVYERRLKTLGKKKADWRFILDVTMLFRPGIIRKAGSSKNLNPYSMYKSYFKIGWRNLIRNKGYSFINIGGLAMGMAVAMLIGLWIYDELNFNTYHKNYNRIARVMRTLHVNGETVSTTTLPNALGDELRTKYGNQFQQVVMAALAGDHILSASGETTLSLRGEFVESAAPEMFTLNMLQGSWSGLNDPHSILISQSAAKALFGDDNPMGKLLKIDNSDRMDVKVAGVYEDLPYNTDFHDMKFYAPFDLLFSANAWVQNVSFTNDFLNIYVAIADHTTFESASTQIKDAILNNVRENKGYVDVNPQLVLHPMKDWHLRSEWKNGVMAGGATQIVWLFGIVGAFVLLLACINFMNLSTARSEKRAREVGIRKAVGSARQQLMNQFFTESFLTVGLAFVVALVAVSTSLNWFNHLANKQIEMPWMNTYFWLASFVFILFTGLLAGSYPALYLSSFNAVKVLKGSIRVGKLASLPRKVLVVTQFTVSVTLIIGTIMVYQQIQFAKNRPVGYSRDGLLMIQMTTPDFHGKQDVLFTELKNTGAVLEMAESSSPPTAIWSENGGFDWSGKDPAYAPQFATLTVTAEYGKTIGWQFVKGRDFSENIASDSAGFVINEATAKLLGFENPVGETLRWQGGWRSKFTSFTIIGVIKDMVVKSPYAPPVPSVFFLSKYGTNWFNIRINPQTSVGEALPKIKAVFKKLIPSAPFDYKFADQEYALKFAAEERVGKLAFVFAVLAILISCLGLSGLASFVAEQRTKEIGIRKVIGASVFSLWKMLSKDFVFLMIIACLIAIPTSYYLLAAWLENYDYRAEISWWIFAVTFVLSLVITVLTVSWQALKAAMMNPVNSLRSE
ncbi:ABC-type antimicrobial peptide transport system, permease component [Chryseolinea serpens]|uniref:ABC-type antimicrobial peptide transport system, permease component n=1 Tax=Chryseolinea serpens TaxID=947013 RepID=A0A1M5TSN0_9BACT|nr:ABC transporter permease [Chryseolinea serpens]SHH53825.1 ABC-type antimicrobial peptide transport system, permease component [Chryseolinea serpens]